MFGCGDSGSAMAQPGDNSGSGGGGTAGSSSSGGHLVAGYSSKYWSEKTGKNLALFIKSPSYGDNLLSNLFYNHLMKNIDAGKSPYGDPIATTIISLLSASEANAVTALAKSMAIPAPIGSGNTLYYIKHGSSKVESKKISSKDVAQISGPLSISSLIAPLQYKNKTARDSAKTFVNYLAGLYNLPPVIDLSKLSKNQINQALNKKNVQEYLTAVRQMASHYSVSLSNLYYLYDQRVAVPTDKLGGSYKKYVKLLPKNMQKEASPLAIDHWMATRRLTGSGSKSWNAEIEKATPATLQREMVRLLAEMRFEMYKTRMVNERILATASANQLQSTFLNQFTAATIGRSICDEKPLKGTNACPTKLKKG